MFKIYTPIFISLLAVSCIWTPLEGAVAADYTAKPQTQSGGTLYNRQRPKPTIPVIVDEAEKKINAESSGDKTQANEGSVDAETTALDKVERMPADAIDRAYIERMGQLCVSHWENQECLKTISEISLTVASNYAHALDSKGLAKHNEGLKQHCAAATAATRTIVPGYAMKSALTECVNAIYEINQATQVKPDETRYQLLVSAILCLSSDESCGFIEKSLLAPR